MVFLDDGTAEAGDTQLESIAHGVIELERSSPGYGAARRRLEVLKLRGVDFITGKHDFIIAHGGLQVFPRLVAAAHRKPYRREVISSGVPGLDAMLGGGLQRGTSTAASSVPPGRESPASRPSTPRRRCGGTSAWPCSASTRRRRSSPSATEGRV